MAEQSDNTDGITIDRQDDTSYWWMKNLREAVPASQTERSAPVSLFPPNRFQPCACCGRIETDMDAVEVIGALEDVEGRRCFILYQCRCNNTRAISWDEAPEEMKIRVLQAEG